MAFKGHWVRLIGYRSEQHNVVTVYIIFLLLFYIFYH